MNITVLSRLSMCPDDVALLDRMAASAGKSRDDFVSDMMFHMLTIEREFIARHAEGDDGVKNNGGRQ